jgi:flagellar M-ring protein FliF
MNFFQRIGQQIADIWRGMSQTRKIMTVFFTVLTLGLILGIGYFASQPDYRVLYSNLPPEDSGAITTKLQASAIPYSLTNNGSTILVPLEKLQQARIDLAVDGLPAKGGKGFEIFDSAPLGMTPFTQHVNFERALSSELARSIMQLDPISFARVHIVLPDSSPFVRDQKPTTASVMVKLKAGAVLNRGMAAGIVALVARSVEGLDPGNVTLVDTAGHVLSDNKNDDAGPMASSQLEYRRELEKYLAAKAEDMLGQLLGPGRAIVRVTADVNFKRVKEQKTTYSPDDKVVKTEKLVTSKSTTPGAAPKGTAGTQSNVNQRPPATPAGNNGTQSDETIDTSYEVSKTVQELEDKAGNVERITVAAMVDLGKGDSPDSGRPPVTLTVEEAQEIIKQAVGFKKDRDEIKVTDVHLVPPASLDHLDKDVLQMEKWQYYVALARHGAIGFATFVVLVLGLVVLRRFRTLAAPKSEKAAKPEDAQALDNLSTMALQQPQVLARALAAFLEQSDKPVKVAA